MEVYVYAAGVKFRAARVPEREESCTLRRASRHHLPHPTPVRRTNLTGLILEQLRHYVLTHGFTAEDRLPPERDLAARLSVSRPSLRNALDWLSERGALRRVQGGGTFLQPNFLEVLTEAGLGATNPERNIAEVIEARVHLEPILARLAAERITADQATALRAEVAQAADLMEDVAAWRDHDLRLHVRIARLAGNSILCATIEAVYSDIVRLWREHSEELDRRELQSEHEAIVDAIAHGDADTAEQRMREHLESLHRAASGRQLRAVSA